MRRLRGITKLKSSFSAAAGHCVDVEFVPGFALVTDTKDKKRNTLQFTPDEWKAFVKGVKNDEFDFPE
jgi:hypothetical protein